jgi:hypothetical protein
VSFSRAVLALALALAGGCDEPDATLRTRPTPDKATASRLMREALENDVSIREKLCGPGTSTLSNLELNVADNVIPGTFNAEVYASPSSAPTKRCEGVIAGIFDAVDRSADPLEFKLTKLDVLEVRTPGLEWKKKPGR